MHINPPVTARIQEAVAACSAFCCSPAAHTGHAVAEQSIDQRRPEEEVPTLTRRGSLLRNRRQWRNPPSIDPFRHPTPSSPPAHVGQSTLKGGSGRASAANGL